MSNTNSTHVWMPHAGILSLGDDGVRVVMHDGETLWIWHKHLEIVNTDSVLVSKAFIENYGLEGYLPSHD